MAAKKKAAKKSKAVAKKTKKKDVTDPVTKEEMKKKAKMIAELARVGANADMKEFAAKLSEYMQKDKDKGPTSSSAFNNNNNATGENDCEPNS